MPKITLDADRLLGFRLVGTEAGSPRSTDRIADKTGSKLPPKDEAPKDIPSIDEKSV